MTLLAGWGVLEKKNICNNIYCAASEQPVDVDTKSLYFSLCLYLSSSYRSHVRSVRVCVYLYTHICTLCLLDSAAGARSLLIMSMCPYDMI